MAYPSRARRSLIARRASSRWVDTLTVPLRILGFAVTSLPIGWVQRLGRLLGALWFSIVPIRRPVVVENLSTALPELSSSRRRAIAKQTFQHVATTVLELLWLSRPRFEDLEHLVSVEGLENYHRVREAGRGVIAVTAHIGNWDLLACSQAIAGIPLHIVTKELSARRLSQLWMNRRREAGIAFIPARKSILAILRALRRGEVVGMVVDQRTAADEGGVLLPFFGRPAWTTRAPHILAARTGAALLPVSSYRRRDGRHVVSVGEELELESTPEATMESINHHVEKWVRQNPEQWLWLHRRWKL